MYSLKKRLNDNLAFHSGKTVDQIKDDSDRDYYMSAAEAADYGLIDKVLESKVDSPAASSGNGEAAE